METINDRVGWLPTIWGVDSGQVTVYLPEELRTLTIEEAIARAEHGDRLAARDCIEVWRSIGSGHTPAEMSPELDAFVVRWLESMGELGHEDATAGRKRQGRPPRGRAGWVRDRVLEGDLEPFVKEIEEDPAYHLPPEEVLKTAIQRLAEERKKEGKKYAITEGAVKKALERASKSRPIKDLGYVYELEKPPGYVSVETEE